MLALDKECKDSSWLFHDSALAPSPQPAIHHPPFTIRHSPSAIHHPPFTIRYSPSAIHHPLFAIRYSLIVFLSVGCLATRLPRGYLRLRLRY
jgi:hypothetical protein